VVADSGAGHVWLHLSASDDERGHRQLARE
jgi:hypothetical protein